MDRVEIIECIVKLDKNASYKELAGLMDVELVKELCWCVKHLTTETREKSFLDLVKKIK